MKNKKKAVQKTSKMTPREVAFEYVLKWSMSNKEMIELSEDSPVNKTKKYSVKILNRNIVVLKINGKRIYRTFSVTDIFNEVFKRHRTKIHNYHSKKVED